MYLPYFEPPIVIHEQCRCCCMALRTNNSTFTLFLSIRCDTKEKEFLHERQSLCERQKTLQQSQQRLVDGQELLNKRESHIFERTQELNRKEKELEASKLKLEEELQALAEEQANLKIKASSLSLREEVRMQCISFQISSMVYISYMYSHICLLL